MEFAGALLMGSQVTDTGMSWMDLQERHPRWTGTAQRLAGSSVSQRPYDWLGAVWVGRTELDQRQFRTARGPVGRSGWSGMSVLGV